MTFESKLTSVLTSMKKQEGEPFDGAKKRQLRQERIQQLLSGYGFKMEPSLSALDGSCGHALVDLQSGELDDPPNEHVYHLALEWSLLEGVYPLTESEEKLATELGYFKTDNGWGMGEPQVLHIDGFSLAHDEAHNCFIGFHQNSKDEVTHCPENQAGAPVIDHANIVDHLLIGQPELLEHVFPGHPFDNYAVVDITGSHIWDWDGAKSGPEDDLTNCSKPGL